MKTHSKTTKRVVELVDEFRQEGFEVYERSFADNLSRVKMFHTRNCNKIMIVYDNLTVSVLKNNRLVKSESISVAADGGDA